MTERIMIGKPHKVPLSLSRGNTTPEQRDEECHPKYMFGCVGAGGVILWQEWRLQSSRHKDPAPFASDMTAAAPFERRPSAAA